MSLVFSGCSMSLVLFCIYAHHHHQRGLFINELCINFFLIFLRFFFSHSPSISQLYSHQPSWLWCKYYFVINFVIVYHYVNFFISLPSSQCNLLASLAHTLPTLYLCVGYLHLLRNFLIAILMKMVIEERIKKTTHCLNDSFYLFLL